MNALTTQTSKRPSLKLRRPTPAEAVFASWVDDAIDFLLAMPHSCALDVVDERGGRSEASEIGRLLGMSRQAAATAIRDATTSLESSLRAHGIDEEHTGD